jgi:hypothetical protein
MSMMAHPRHLTPHVSARARVASAGGIEEAGGASALTGRVEAMVVHRRGEASPEREVSLTTG